MVRSQFEQRGEEWLIAACENQRGGENYGRFVFSIYSCTQQKKTSFMHSTV